METHFQKICRCSDVLVRELHREVSHFGMAGHILSSETLDQHHEQLNEVCIALFQLLQIVG